MKQKTGTINFPGTGLFLVIFLLLSQLVFTQNMQQGIQGKVRDRETLKYLGSVNLTIGTSFGTSSKPDGSFRIAGIPEGIYRLEASMVGYHPVSHVVEVKKNSFSNIQIDLKPEVILIDSVDILGRKINNYISVPTLEPASMQPVISLVSRQEIEKQGAISLIDAMKYVPGALTETRGRKVKQFFSVRGQRYPYPDYAINGIWQREFYEMPYFISASDIEEVEIIRSSAAFLTGLSGLAGIINIKTREYDQSETSAELEYGSFNTMHSHVSHGGQHENYSYAAGLGYDKTDGPDQKNAAEGIGNIYCRLNWEPLKELDISAGLYYLDGKRELALAEEPAGKRFREEISSFDQIRSTLLNLKVNYRTGKNASTEVQVFFTDRKPIYKWEDINTNEIFKISEKDHEWGINLIQALTLSQKNTLRFGGLYNHWIAPDGKRFYVGKLCDLETISGVVADEHDFGSFVLDGAIRWTRTYMNDYGAFNIDGSGTGFSGVTPVVNEWQPANLQVALGFRWNLSKTLMVFYHSATGKIKPREGSLDENLNEPGNETRTKFDLGIQTVWKQTGKITLTGFLVNQNDAIVYSGNTYEQNGLVMELYENRDEDHFGVEVEVLSPRLMNYFSAFINLTAMRSVTEENGQMKRSNEFPEIITNGGILFERSGIDFNLFWKYVGGFESSRFVQQIQGEPTIYAPLGDYFVTDMSGGYSFGKTITTRVCLRIQNLTDIKYSTVAGYPDFGRRLSLGVRIRI